MLHMLTLKSKHNCPTFIFLKTNLFFLPHTFVEIDHEIISTVILLPSADSFKKVVVSYKREYVHELLVIRLFKPAQEKVWLGELTVPQ